MIFGPRYIRFENGKIINDKLHIWTVIREGVDPRDIKISVIGKGTKSTNILRKLLKFDKMKFKKEVAIKNSVEILKESSVFKLRLFYKDEEMD
jgi:hypothetical protein